MQQHYCNTWHEETLIKPKITLRSLHYLFQYLPLLYAKKGDKILVDALPLDPIENFEISLYRGEQDVEFWVKPDELTNQLLSKEFIFLNSERPKNSIIVYDKEEAAAFEKKMHGRVVFKQLVSYSAIGHARKHQDILNFPCLAEPWFERTVDFSTQWIVHRSGVEYLGITRLLVSSQGGYRGTEIGTLELDKKTFDLHYHAAYDVLEQIRSLGFCGNVGFDAFCHTEGVQLICEMNPRKTMGYVALMYAKNHNLEKMRLLIGSNPSHPLLPKALVDRHNLQLQFPKNLFLDKL